MARGFRMSNPVFTRVKNDAETSANAVTRAGVGFKTIFFLLVAVISGLLVASGMDVNLDSGSIVMSGLSGFLIGSAIIFLLVGYIGSWFSIGPVFPTLYVIGIGAVLGQVSVIADLYYPGIVMLAIAGTASVFFTMTSLYNLGIIKATDKFRAVVMGMMASYLMFSIVVFIIGLFNGSVYNTFFGSTSLGILIGAFAVLLGALMLIISFDSIDECVAMGIDKRLEWRLAFGLASTIIWLFIQILQLLLRIAERTKN